MGYIQDLNKATDLAKSTNTSKKETVEGRRIGDTTSFARVVYWHYNKQNFAKELSSFRSLKIESPDNIMETTKGLLESEITDISISKTMNSAAGTFSISLLPSQNWKQFIAPGDWLAIYLFSSTNDYASSGAVSPKNMVMLGNVDRVSRTKQRDEQSDKVTVRYVVSGRDFGKVMEDTQTWFNPYLAQSANNNILLETAGIPFTGNPGTLLNSCIDVFLNSKGAALANTAIGKGKTKPLNQWIIPAEVAELFDVQEQIVFGNELIKTISKEVSSFVMGGLKDSFDAKNGVHFDDILQRIIPTDMPGNRGRLMLNKNDILWNFLKRSSNDVVNDFYCELVRDIAGDPKPSIVLKPHPNSAFFKDPVGKLNGHYKSLQDYADLNSVEIDPSDIKYEDLGKDGNSRVNMTWLTVKQSNNAKTNEMANLALGPVDGIGLPMQNIESMNRYGLKQSNRELEFAYVSNESKELNRDVELFKSFISQLYDMNVYNHLYDTGSIVSVGNNQAEIGKVLKVKSQTKGDKGAQDKIYYVEGYSHSWTFPGQWETDWTVTTGQFNDRSKPFIDHASDDSGQYDKEMESRYLVKTQVKRPIEPSSLSGSDVLYDKFKGLA